MSAPRTHEPQEIPVSLRQLWLGKTVLRGRQEGNGCPAGFWRRAPVGRRGRISPIMSRGGDATGRSGESQAGIHLKIRCREDLRPSRF